MSNPTSSSDYQLLISKNAKSDLTKIPRQIAFKIDQEILGLAKNPRPQGAIKLTNEEGYRLRVGDYRILYLIDDKLRRVTVSRIKNRKDAYR